MPIYLPTKPLFIYLKVYVNDIYELKKKRKAANMKMSGLMGFASKSPAMNRRGSLRPQKSTDQSKPKGNSKFKRGPGFNPCQSSISDCNKVKAYIFVK